MPNLRFVIRLWDRVNRGDVKRAGDSVLVDGNSVGAVASYTFTNVQANHTIAASFALIRRDR